MEIGTTLYVTNRRQWRTWLARHHKTASEIWLIYYKKHSGKPRIPYNDAVEEALCYGWIDSLTKPMDEYRWAQAGELPAAVASLPQDDGPEQAVRDGAVTQLTLSTASMKLSVLVSTHSTDAASTFMVPMRSVLVVTTRPLVGEGLMSRATAMPRRGS